MSYTVRQLATLAGVSVRTLQYYDTVGVLQPMRVSSNGYRRYTEGDLLKLQQILFFKELDFPLSDIRRMMTSPSFSMREALSDEKRLIEIKKRRLSKLIKTIDTTLTNMNKTSPMDNKELYGNFSKEEYERYADEARKRWGHTNAYAQSQERVKKMGPKGLRKVLEKSSKLTIDIAACMTAGEDPKGKTAQALIALHYDGLRAFYEPDLELYRGLADMYLTDGRFKANYENVAKGLAQFMHDAMMHFARTPTAKNSAMV